MYVDGVGVLKCVLRQADVNSSENLCDRSEAMGFSTSHRGWILERLQIWLKCAAL